MKNVLLSLFIAFLFLASCSDNDENPTKPISTDLKDLIVGNWLMTGIIIYYPEGPKEESPTFFNAVSYMRFYSNARYSYYRKLNGFVDAFEGTYSTAGQDEIRLTIEDPRNPNNPSLYTYGNLYLYSISNEEMKTYATVGLYDDDHNPVYYDAFLVYKRQK